MFTAHTVWSQIQGLRNAGTSGQGPSQPAFSEEEDLESDNIANLPATQFDPAWYLRSEDVFFGSDGEDTAHIEFPIQETDNIVMLDNPDAIESAWSELELSSIILPDESSGSFSWWETWTLSSELGEP